MNNGTGTSGPPTSTGVQRDPSAFDFREVMMVTALVLRPDYLQEYLDDGKEKDQRNVPLAVNDPKKWPTLRTLFNPDTLGQMLYLFELPETQSAALQIKRVFETIINLNDYDLDQCPNSNVVLALTTYAGQQSESLNRAGVKDK